MEKKKKKDKTKNQKAKLNQKPAAALVSEVGSMIYLLQTNSKKKIKNKKIARSETFPEPDLTLFFLITAYFVLGKYNTLRYTPREPGRGGAREPIRSVCANRDPELRRIREALAPPLGRRRGRGLEGRL